MVKPTEILNFPPPLHPLRQLQLVCVCVQLYADTLISAAWMTTHSVLASFNKRCLFFGKINKHFTGYLEKTKQLVASMEYPHILIMQRDGLCFVGTSQYIFRTSK